MANEDKKAETALREAMGPSLISGKTKGEEEAVPAVATKARWGTMTVQVCGSHP